MQGAFQKSSFMPLAEQTIVKYTANTRARARRFNTGRRRFADALRDAIENAPLRNLPAIGAVDQFVDSTDLADDPALVTKLRAVFT